MATEFDRRAFLRGASAPRIASVIRPPGALVDGFEDACTSCSACIDACPENVVGSDDKGQPYLDFQAASCTFCAACIDVCPTTALSQAQLDAWNWVARVTPACMSLNGISCRVCEDTCEEAAIRFRLQTGGRAQPLIDTDACTGCGACVSVCPSQSVEIVQRNPEAQEAVA